MLDVFRPGESLAWDYLWQSTLFLGLGLATSIILARRPARAHRLLLLAVLAAIVTPLLSQAARRGGWGLLAGTADRPPTDRIAAPAPAVVPDLSSAGRPPFPPLDMTLSGPREPVPSVRVAEPRAVDSPSLPARTADSVSSSRVAWRTLASGAWLLLAGLAAARLVLGVVIGQGVARRARPLDDAELEAASARAAVRLGVGRPPELRTSTRVQCPAIWCWSRRPVILLPISAGGGSPVDWVGVFCHELAHWLRRDHLSGLVAEFLTCLLPWNPLAWWARHRLAQLSELACDDWALSTELEPTDYADSLLGLVPHNRGAIALAAVSSRRGLIGRLQHILEERRIRPEVGKRWACATAAAMVLAASAVALAQSRPAPTESRSPESQVSATRDERLPTQPTKPEQPSMNHTIRGTVLGPDDKPVPGADVFLVGTYRPKVVRSALPRDDEERSSPRRGFLARSSSQATGRFTLTAEIDTQELVSLQAVVAAAGFGPSAQILKKYAEAWDEARIGQDELTFRLAPRAIIQGRLLTPIGRPAAGVRVTLVQFGFADGKRDGMSGGPSAPDGAIPSYWPGPRTTDAEGRFTLEGVPMGSYAVLSFQHPDFADDEVIVDTSDNDPPTTMLRARGTTAVKPTFTHSLEPSRPVQGRVTDKATGKPLAGFLVEVTTSRGIGGMPRHTRTDADGRYRISGRQGDTYTATVYPPGDSGYLGSSDRQRGWPAGAKILEKNFALERGRILRGRVLDADTGRPVAGAAVVLATERENPALTNADGRFAISGRSGGGDLLVEAPGEYIRTRFLRGRNEATTLFPHGHISVNAPDQGEATPVEIAVRKGVTFTARVVGPDGKPVSPFAAYCPEMSGTATTWSSGSTEFPGDRFIFIGADPSRTYRVIFVSARHQLAAVVEIKPDSKAAQPVEIRLQPAARVHGRVVKPSGLPMSEGEVFPMIVLGKIPENAGRDLVFSQMFYLNLLEASARAKYGENSEVQGEFTHVALVPGCLSTSWPWRKAAKRSSMSRR
jgi:beta-lactamase regulating signal transducer with metallopeptidase domain/protocatechuate 3,4-dioxygenase beta subunit